MTNKQLLDLLGEMGDRHVLSLDHAPKVRKRRPMNWERIFWTCWRTSTPQRWIRPQKGNTWM